MAAVAEPTHEPAAAIELDQLSLGWRDKVAVRDLSGCFRRGSLTAVVGPNGAGKSTLLRGIMGWVTPLAGRIRVNASADSLAFMPQQGDFDRSFPIAARDFVAMGAWRRVGPWRGFCRSERQRVEDALHAVGLGDFGRRPLATLSGGQLQRALFARLMLHDADIVMLDEPFSAVDRATTEDLMTLLMQWHERGKTVIVVLHDLELVRRHFPQTLLLAGQGVAWCDTEAALTPENLHLARHLCAGDYL
ncbi:metal ABC transporter ATP-binding protein [Yanghanlia caeni]|uniref:ABC transporter ATP-binding protein n=1 Tax=Yanghanlia caeni TaxID=3064283 RepID=A0ABU1D313_9BURK|nr:ABC transporter ATP-binding protein [Alcaligenaceae bacterium LG-2]